MFGGPAVLSTMPLWFAPHNLSGQFSPDDSGLPPINQRSHDTVPCHRRSFLMM